MRSIRVLFLLAAAFLTQPVMGQGPPDNPGLVAALGQLAARVEALETQLTALEGTVAGLSPGILNVSYVTGFDFKDDRDSGPADGRVLTFDKLEADSVLRITYSDNIRVHSKNPEALIGTPGTRWIVHLDGIPTQVRTRLLNHAHVAGVGFARAVNSHRQSTLIGYLEGVSAGQHTINIVLFDEGNANDAFTGFTSSFLLEVMELP